MLLRILFFTLAVLLGVQGKTYSFCNNQCTVSFDTDCAIIWTTDAKKFACSQTVKVVPDVYWSQQCKTLFTTDGSSWSCAQWSIPRSYPSSISSCPGHIVLNQTDNEVSCIDHACPGVMRYTDSGWACYDGMCPSGWLTTKTDFPGGSRYVCELPDCKGNSYKDRNEKHWVCDERPYLQGRKDYFNDYILIFAGVFLVTMLVVGFLCHHLGKSNAKRISSNEEVLTSSMAM